jgi:hypothetical protein
MPREAVSSEPVNTQAGQTRPAGAVPPGVGGAAAEVVPPGYAECHFCTVVKKRRSWRCRRCIGRLDLRERLIRAAEARPRRRVGSALSLLVPGLGHAWSAHPAGGLFYFAVVAIGIAYYATLQVEPNVGRWMTLGALALIWVIAALDVARGQGDARPPCQEACPARLACMHYVTHIRERRFLASLEQIMHLCPLPASIGRICHHPCEKDCRRGREGEPIGICALKRFVADGYHGETRDFYRLAAPAQPVFPERIAVVGGGPSGLSAALVLRIMGFAVTLFEAEAEAGGMPGAAIPDYRLPQEIYRREVAAMLAAGIETRFGRRLGRDFQLADLAVEGFVGVYLALGCQRTVKLPHCGPPEQGFLDGLDLLKQAKLGTVQPLAGPVLVIGGGNVAMDVAKTALRLGASEVRVIFLETREAMPAHTWECDEALAEGSCSCPPPPSHSRSTTVTWCRRSASACSASKSTRTSGSVRCSGMEPNSRFRRRPCSRRSVLPRITEFSPPRCRAPRSGRGRSWAACRRLRGSRSRCSMVATICPARLR